MRRQVLVLDVDARDPGRAGQRGAVLVHDQRAIHLAERAAEGADHVRDLEADRGVDGVESPGARRQAPAGLRGIDSAHVKPPCVRYS